MLRSTHRLSSFLGLYGLAANYGTTENSHLMASTCTCCRQLKVRLLEQAVQDGRFGADTSSEAAQEVGAPCLLFLCTS